MKIYRLHYPHDQQELNLEPSAVAVGFFDVLHRGHEDVIGRMEDIAEAEGLKKAVMTFDPHPSVVLSPKKQRTPYLTPLDIKLEMLEEGGDLEVSGFITSYDVTPTAVTSQEIAAQNRLTVTVKIIFKNNKHEEEDFEKSFAAYQDYDSNLSLDAVEAQLVDEIVEILVEDIFNATVANW